MADSTTPIPQVIAGTGAAAQVNSLIDAASPAALFGRNAATTTGLTWGFLGGRIGGVLVANGTVTLTASSTNYVVALTSTGVVSASTAVTNWDDTAAYTRLYLVVTGASTVSSYQDWRDLLGGGGAGGLNNFTESVNSAAPNATVPVVQLLALNAATNVDAALTPKGSGALLAHIPNNLATGGNKRGTFAVDWQMSRTLNTHIAAGTGAVIGGGANNGTVGIYATIAGGQGNVTLSNYATVGGGQTNSASTSCTVSGGLRNTASSNSSAIGGGNDNIASGALSSVPGGRLNEALSEYGLAIGYRARARIRGQFSRACGGPTNAGSAQGSAQVQYIETTTATPENMLAEDNPVAGSRYELANNMSATFRIMVVAVQHTTGDTKAWEVTGCVKRRATAATTAFVGTPTVTALGNDAGAASWAIAAVVDTTNGAVAIEVTGDAAKTIRWAADYQMIELVSG